MLWSLGIGTIALNKAIKGKGCSKGHSILCGVDCTPVLALDKEEGISFPYSCEAIFFRSLPTTAFFLFITGL